jgi:predicted metal-dependent hydrolase
MAVDEYHLCMEESWKKVGIYERDLGFGERGRKEGYIG